MKMKSASVVALASLLAFQNVAFAESADTVADDVIAAQRAALAANTDGAGFGPQSPRDISVIDGTNARSFQTAPAFSQMNLCDIHFHENAEHRGGEFTEYAGNGDGHGYGTGFKYAGELTEAELAPIDAPIGATEHGDLQPGDTIEVHYVFSTAQAQPGPTLGTCLSDAINNPQLRVEAQVFVLVNDADALDFTELAKVEMVDGLYQAPNIPTNTGDAITYAGSTTGPSYNENGSPFQVTWNVRPNVARVDINTVGTWFEDNVFEEDHAHGVRNLVTNPDLLSAIAE
ncbi:delta-class carbonic anhydrase [Loktanella sp. S4079]|uniref:delta-class carbonic anhydrase n=1 Tax=Loktanella sp. S4079 TaxID=579483 RepID=UPI000A8A8ACB|nr:delta-class carbonic anhydrase [Loktanella sp. S4079]